MVELVFHARIFLRMQKDGVIAPDEPFMLSGFLKPDAKHIFDSEFDFVANGNGKLTRALRACGIASDPLPHLSISRLVLRAPDERLRAFMSINSSKGPIVGTASLRMKLASPGFLSNLGTIPLEIAEFANGMAADDLIENIRLVADGYGHAVTSSDEILGELQILGSKGYTLVMGGGGSRTNADLMEAFVQGNGGKLF